MSANAIIVHNLEHALAALSAAGRLGTAVTLASPPGAAAYLGAAVFRDMIGRAAAAHPGVEMRAVLDCGDDPGLALGALRQGIKWVRIEAPEEVRARLGDIAAQLGAALDEGGPGDLDLLGAEDPFEACRAWLADR